MNTVKAKDLWKATDVSILLPLPKSLSDLNNLLSPNSIGLGGLLIPKPMAAQLPSLVLNKLNTKVFADELKVIGIRMDPCFQEGFTTTMCRRQIRLVWQPVILKKSKYTTTDAAVHTFYDLSEQQWADFLSKYSELISNTRAVKSNLSLRPHPLISIQGMNGEYWKSMRALILQFAGATTLTKITLMSLEASEDNWIFTGFNVKGSELKSMSIPKLGSSSTQSVMMAVRDSNEFLGTVFPNALSTQGLWFFDNSKEAKEKFTEAELFSFALDTLEIENPLKHNSGTTDCASCHTSETVVSWHLRNFPKWDWSQILSNEGFAGEKNASERIKNPVKTNQLRAFGYQDSTPRFSQRLRKETEHVLELLK